MASSFLEIGLEARNRWQELIAGEKPWIRIGTALCGEAAGAFEVADAVELELAHQAVSAQVSRVGCLGLCFAEPLMDVQLPGGHRVFYGNVSPNDVAEIVSSHVSGGAPVAGRALGYIAEESSDAPLPDGIPDLNQHPMRVWENRIVLRNSGNIDPLDIYQYVANGGYQALHKALIDLDREQTLEEVKSSGLRGRGGAAFPTATKWSFLAGNPAPEKYVLCNCEEGDPGAFNDKNILESDPNTLVEGVIIAGYATGASKGYIFIRHGHDGPIERCRAAVEQARELGFLGSNIMGSDFGYEIEIALTGDSYVAGEESALMEAIEGKRAMPRFRPPFPAQFGLFGKPTNINNVKTLSYVPEIVSKGGEWFAGIGHDTSTGTVILCLSGNLKYTGMVEVPLGINLKDVIFEAAGGMRDGKTLKFLQTGGPLGGVLGVDSIDVLLDFEILRAAGAIVGSGGLIAADDSVCIVDMTRSLIAFCQYESCGKCFPCRMGMSHLLEVLERICSLEGTPEDLMLMRNIGENMQAGSLCGHGQLGFNPVSSALRYFGPEFDTHINNHECATGTCSMPRYSPALARR
ncbi:MAG: NADH-ubiquinone oxidoreductase-F iron-sulfur binding region domain-containing protein [Chloroflexota bacterium]|nr:NADH-ubiquinone oxidoreductase-F iron-sulfur binding region domain-containing protein [Chloroflexota bacterium]